MGKKDRNCEETMEHFSCFPNRKLSQISFPRGMGATAEVFSRLLSSQALWHRLNRFWIPYSISKTTFRSYTGAGTSKRQFSVLMGFNWTILRIKSIKKSPWSMSISGSLAPMEGLLWHPRWRIMGNWLVLSPIFRVWGTARSFQQKGTFKPVRKCRQSLS